MPSRPGHPHSENLPWMEVPQPLPAAEEQSDSGGSVVPSICGEPPCSVLSAEGTEENSSSFLLSSLVLFLNRRLCLLSNKRNTRRSSAPPPWCSPTPEGGR